MSNNFEGLEEMSDDSNDNARVEKTIKTLSIFVT